MTRTKVFVSYTHDSPEHKDQVRRLSDRLRRDGLECMIDQYVSGTPPEAWPRWMLNQIESADFVLTVCTETYRRRFRGKERPGKGKGAQWEGAVITQEIYENAAQNTKFVPVIFHDADKEHIPIILRGASYYDLSNESGYDALYRYLTEQPEVIAPPLGEVRRLPPLEQDVHSSPIPEYEQPIPEPYGNVPEQNRFFTGREDILSELADVLRNQGRAMISGLGGMGKTQIAIEYTHSHRDEYDAILWVTAETETALTSDYVHLARVLNLPQKHEQNQQVIMQAVKTWLDRHDGWLLVFDSANVPTLLEPLWPQSATGHVLVTTRAQQAQRLGLPAGIPTNRMTQEDAFDFLKTRTGRSTLPVSEQNAMNGLAQELGCLPLALEQAAAYLVQKQASFENYLIGYRRRRLELLEQAAPIMGGYRESVATTWLLNFEQVEASSLAAGDLLRASAFLAPDNIPLEIFAGAAEHLGSALADALVGVEKEPLAMDEVLEPLTRYSLIRRDVERHTFSVHSLVQEVVRGSLIPEQHALWEKRTTQALNLVFPQISFPVWSLCDRLMPHAQVVARRIDETPSDAEAASNLLNRIGHYAYERARYAETDSYVRHALKIAESILGPNHALTALSLNNLAQLLTILGRLDEAEPLHQRALDIRERLLGPDYPSTAESLNNFAFLLLNKGENSEAEPLFRRAIAIDEQTLGPDHPNLISGLNNLATVLQRQGKHVEAESLFRRALDICEQALEPNHPLTGNSLNNLAGLLSEHGKYKETESLYRHALNIREETLGPEHPDTAVSIGNLAAILFARGKYNESESLLRRAVGILEKALGPDHPNTITFREANQFIFRLVSLPRPIKWIIRWMLRFTNYLKTLSTARR